MLYMLSSGKIMLDRADDPAVLRSVTAKKKKKLIIGHPRPIIASS